jgi:hypothetical protein
VERRRYDDRAGSSNATRYGLVAEDQDELDGAV